MGVYNRWEVSRRRVLYLGERVMCKIRNGKTSIEVTFLRGQFQLKLRSCLSKHDSCCFSSIFPSETGEMRLTVSAFRKKLGQRKIFRCFIKYLLIGEENFCQALAAFFYYYSNLLLFVPNKN